MNRQAAIKGKSKKTSRGGKRPGSGRKPLVADGVRVQVSLTLSPLAADWLRAQPAGASATVRKLVDEAMQTP